MKPSVEILANSRFSSNELENKLSPINLTKRELEILHYVADGYSAKKIGILLNISYRTVEKYIENLRLKLNCKNKVVLAITFLKENFHAPVIE